MSGEAITRRLKQVDQLRELSLSLMKAKKVSDENKKNVEKNQNRTDDSENPVSVSAKLKGDSNI